MVGSFVISGLLGVIIALRLMAIEEKEQGKKSKLTVRGKIVVALLIGLAIATFIVLINGMWWNCDTSTCSFTWGY
jgi:hypothetical protein